MIVKSDILDMIDKLVEAGRLHTEVMEDLGKMADDYCEHILKEKLDRQAAEHAQRCERCSNLMDQIEDRFRDFIMMACGIGFDKAKEALVEIKKGRFPGDIIREGQGEGKLIVRLPDGSVQENTPDKMWSPQPKSPFPLMVDVKVDPESQEHRDYVADLIRGHLTDGVHEGFEGRLVVRCDLDPDTDDLSFIWRIEWEFTKEGGEPRGVALEVGHKEGTLVKDLPTIAKGLAGTLKAKRKRAYKEES